MRNFIIIDDPYRDVSPETEAAVREKLARWYKTKYPLLASRHKNTRVFVISGAPR